ncbi:MAG: metal-dependent transcriptional regulator [Actinomycetota bacterium]|nr:metal-dependent transcriptional regulator [Actinomycetota bacterium]
MGVILSRSERETLKAIYRLGGLAGDTAGAHTGDLAHALGISPGTATATIKRLADRGLAEHKLYRGVLLTREGRRAASAAIRRHRIVERFLSDMLGYPWNEADRLAATFEHELPQEVEERLYVALHRPATCPHGFPIPEPAEADIPDLPPLYDLEPGDVAVVAVPGATDDEVVAFLETLGLRPGVRVEVKEKHPFDGPLVLVVDGHQRTVGEKVARQVHVSKNGDVPAGLSNTGQAVPRRERSTR